MLWRYAFFLSWISLIASCSNSIGTEEARKPNIVMILGDDLGYPYYGFTGHDSILTPNLDKLAEVGIVFPQTHVTASVCQPSLITLLTGLYPLRYNQQLTRHVATTNSQPEYPIEHFKTLPDHLSELGYASFQGGKYWEGPFSRAGFTHGMTESVGPEEIAEHGAILAMAGGDGLVLGRESNEPVYRFIEEHRDQPFYVWYAPMLPHTPHDPPEEFMRMYEGYGLSSATQKYYANITRFDTRVGELLDFLDSTGLRNNTLVFYLADNGYEQEPLDAFHPMGQSRGKGSMHELGFRTPLIFNWAEIVPEGEINQSFVNAVDIFPTILDFAGAEIPVGISGSSIRNNILKNTSTGQDTLFGSMGQLRVDKDNPATGDNPFANDEESLYVTTTAWHFVYYEDRDSLALYDRVADPRELNNLAGSFPALTEQFQRSALSWKDRQLSN